MRTKRDGSLSTYGLMIMAVVLIGSLGVTGYVSTDMIRSRNEQRAVQTFQAAQGGLEHAITTAYANLTNTGGAFAQTTYNFSDTLSSIDNNGVVTATVAPSSDATYAWVTATAVNGSFRKSVRTFINEKNVGIWNNAIFAGSGASGQAINGNVSIAGSVHILGEGEPYIDLNGNGVRDAAESYTDTNHNGVYDPGEPYTDSNGDGKYTYSEPYNDVNGNGKYDPPMTQTSLDGSFSGTGSITNNYSQMPLALQSLVPGAPSLNGVQTLSSEVRVKHGQIAISGNAYIGEVGPISGGTMKAPVDATYVTDGWSGNKGASAVTSDNGTSNAYDVGGLGITYPIISGIGAQTYVGKDGTSWDNEGSFLDNRSLVCPVTTITSTTAAFSYGPDAYGNSISFTPASGATPAKLIVNGVVKFNSDVQIGSKDSITYEGNGTLYGPNVNIDGNLLPAAGKVFPTTARIGVIAKQNMYLACGNGSSQLSMAGAFYAQGTIKSAKQNQIAGTFVANFFDLGTNVPNIYQVPALINNMPPAMPGDKNYYTLKIRGWRERTLAQGG
jgi:hypothetical protein